MSELSSSSHFCVLPGRNVSTKGSGTRGGSLSAWRTENLAGLQPPRTGFRHPHTSSIACSFFIMALNYPSILYNLRVFKRRLSNVRSQNSGDSSTNFSDGSKDFFDTTRDAKPFVWKRSWYFVFVFVLCLGKFPLINISKMFDVLQTFFPPSISSFNHLLWFDEHRLSFKSIW